MKIILSFTNSDENVYKLGAHFDICILKDSRVWPFLLM